MGIGVAILTLVLLVFCWLTGEQEFRTKLILTGIYLVSWLLFFVEPILCFIAQGVLSTILWYSTFGFGGR